MADILAAFDQLEDEKKQERRSSKSSSKSNKKKLPQSYVSCVSPDPAALDQIPNNGLI
jgi:hypothetical protein